MANRRCSVCKRLQSYSKDEYKYLDKDGDLACSIMCVMDWLHLEEADHPFDIPKSWRGGVVRLYDRDRSDICHSDLLGEWYKSYFERNVAEVLHLKGHKMEYEKYGFNWGSKSYTPDFFHLASNSFLEVKGKWGSSQRSKYKSFREAWPDVRMLVVPWVLAGNFEKMRERLI